MGFLNAFLVDIVSLRMKQMSKKVAKRNGFDGEPRATRRFVDFTIDLSFFWFWSVLAQIFLTAKTIYAL